MIPAIPSETADLFAALATRLYATETTDEVVQAACQSAVDLIPGCDHASISVLESPGRLRSAAATDDIARLMDQLESEAGEGPCLDSITDEAFQFDPDITDRTAWPRLAELVLDRTPVRGMIGYRLAPAVHGKQSAFDVFSDEPGALTAEAADIGAVLAAFTSVALRAAEERATVAHLRTALASNREIAKALGILMATHHIDEAAAFDLLRAASSRTNTRLATIAEQVTSSHREQYG